MNWHCDYCGAGYITGECIQCGEKFDMCECNWGQYLCDACWDAKQDEIEEQVDEVHARMAHIHNQDY